MSEYYVEVLARDPDDEHASGLYWQPEKSWLEGIAWRVMRDNAELAIYDCPEHAHEVVNNLNIPEKKRRRA